MKKVLVLLVLSQVLLSSCISINPEPTEPQVLFGSGDYISYGYKPSISQEQMNKDLITFYESWKGTANGIEDVSITKGGGDGYLATYVGVEKPYYVIKGDITGSEPVEWKESDPELFAVGTSEGTGYGLIIFALMAGYDENAQHYFDGVLNTYLRNRTESLNTMSWVIPSKFEIVDRVQPALTGSATDGDFDIAYALLLAHNQWKYTSDDAIENVSYLDLAMELLDDIHNNLISEESGRLLMGDQFKDLGGRFNHSSTRPSDWMLSHLRVFKTYHNGAKWDRAIREIERILPIVCDNPSSLVPDFVEDIDNVPSPVIKDIPFEEWVQNSSGEWVPVTKYKFLEGSKDDMFSTNASRVPWRMSLDYVHYGSEVSKEFLSGVSSWVDTIPGRRLRSDWGDENWYKNEESYYIAQFPENIFSGYDLNGNPVGYMEDQEDWDLAAPYTELHYITPLGFSFMTENKSIEKMDKVWNYVTSSFGGDHSLDSSYTCYFGDTIALLQLLVVSGNWWNPAQS